MVLTNQVLTNFKDAMITNGTATFLYGAVGTSSTTPAATDVRLVDEVFRDSRDGIDTSVTDTFTASLTIETTEANSSTIREFGWFETSGGSTGTAFVRDTLTAITKTSDIQLFLDTTIDFTLIEV